MPVRASNGVLFSRFHGTCVCGDVSKPMHYYGVSSRAIEGRSKRGSLPVPNRAIIRSNRTIVGKAALRHPCS